MSARSSSDRLPVGRGHGVAVGHHQHQVLLEEQPGHQVPAGDREVEHGQVELAAGQLGLEAGGGPLHDDQAELRMALAGHVHQPGDQPAGGGPDHPHPDGAGDLVLAGGHVGDQGVELGEDAPGPGHHHRALLGEAAVGPVDQRAAELPLEPGHMGRDVGLHRVQVLGGGREGAVVADGGQRLQVPQFHR